MTVGAKDQVYISLCCSPFFPRERRCWLPLRAPSLHGVHETNRHPRWRHHGAEKLAVALIAKRLCHQKMPISPSQPLGGAGSRKARTRWRGMSMNRQVAPTRFVQPTGQLMDSGG